MPPIDWGLGGPKQVMGSEFSPNVKGNQWSITAAEKKGRGRRGQQGRRKGENQLQYHRWNISQGPAMTLTWLYDQLAHELLWGIRWDGGKNLSLAPQYFIRAAMAPLATLREVKHLGHQMMTEGPGRGKGTLLWDTQGRWEFCQNSSPLPACNSFYSVLCPRSGAWSTGLGIWGSQLDIEGTWGSESWEQVRKFLQIGHGPRWASLRSVFPTSRDSNSKACRRTGTGRELKWVKWT